MSKAKRWMINYVRNPQENGRFRGATKFTTLPVQIELSDGGQFRRIVVNADIFKYSQSLPPLRRFLEAGRELNKFPALLWWNPFHFLFKPRRNIELNHLCHKPSDFPMSTPRWKVHALRQSLSEH